MEAVTRAASKAPPAADTTPDPALVERVRDGDAAAFEPNAPLQPAPLPRRW